MSRLSSAAPSTIEGLETIINKKFGDGTIKRGNDESLAITRLPTGVLSVDWRLRGGFPRARFTELYGPPSTGKTTLSYYLIATTQASGGQCAFIDVEGKYDAGYAASLGVDIDTLSFHAQKHGNQVIDFIETLLRSKLYDVIVMDSIAALLPMAEYESTMEAASYGTQQAKLMSAALRKLTPALGNCCVVFINQVREGLGGVFVKRDVTSGGRAMGHYASQRIELVRTENLKKKSRQVNPSNGEKKEVEIPTGHRVLLRVRKEQTGAAFEGDSTTFVIDYDLGCIDRIEDLIYLGLVTGSIHKSGTSWSVDGFEEDRQSGRPRFKKWLRNEKIVQEVLEEMISIWEPEETEETNG